MGIVGQIEKRTQAKVVALFRERQGYDYIGNLVDQVALADRRLQACRHVQPAKIDAAGTALKLWCATHFGPHFRSGPASGVSASEIS